MDPVARILILIGIAFVVIGIAWQFGLIQTLRLGRLPGDIFIDREKVKIYFPFMTGLLLSVILSLIMWTFRK